MIEETSLGTKTKLSRGDIITNDFAFGVALDGTYTNGELFDACVKHRPENPAQWHPAISDWTTYNKYVWTPWSRLDRRVADRIMYRCKMTTKPELSDAIVDDYVGTGNKYADAWMNYITPGDRISALTRFYSQIEGLRLLDLGCGEGRGMAVLGAYGVDVYGVEAHPEMYNHRSYLVSDRIIFGDALECLYTFKPQSFDVVNVSMLGTIWWTDVTPYLFRVGELLVPGGLIMLDVMPHKHVALKSVNSYRSAMANSCFTPKLHLQESMLIGIKSKEASSLL